MSRKNINTNKNMYIHNLNNSIRYKPSKQNLNTKYKNVWEELNCIYKRVYDDIKYKMQAYIEGT